MLLTYVDESYTASRYYIAALVIPEREAQPLANALEAVMTRVERNFAIPPLAKLVRARIGVYDHALDVIGSHQVTVILRGMDLDRQRLRYASPDPPHQVVLGHLIERVDEHAEADNELTIMIADEVSDAERHQRNLWQYQQFRTSGYRSRKITQLVYTIHFVPSHSSRLLQAADLIAHMHRRRETHNETDERSHRARERMWSHVAPRVQHQMCWYP